MHDELLELERRVETLELDAKAEKATPAMNVIELHPNLPALP